MARKPVFSIIDLEDADKKDEKVSTVDKRTEEKEFYTERTGNGLYIVKLTAGGEVPGVLKGAYTSGNRALVAISAYLMDKENAKATG